MLPDKLIFNFIEGFVFSANNLASKYAFSGVEKVCNNNCAKDLKKGTISLDGNFYLMAAVNHHLDALLPPTWQKAEFNEWEITKQVLLFTQVNIIIKIIIMQMYIINMESVFDFLHITIIVIFVTVNDPSLQLSCCFYT